ncbi:MAG: DUF1427 family protein [Acidobacteria bacterium]|nr:DUF1427 family protein [Acidobacteriota bacterium]MBV9147460.1 DUF1427 family protein [Acidobacteriota bacterium]MBV9434433.1 DUF1427 family protein [Acidobacteriota bacterium]
MIKTVMSLVLGLLIGAGCRWFDIPVPSPPKLLGALLVVSMTVGYLTTDKLLSQKDHVTVSGKCSAAPESTSHKYRVSAG